MFKSYREAQRFDKILNKLIELKNSMEKVDNIEIQELIVDEFKIDINSEEYRDYFSAIMEIGKNRVVRIIEKNNIPEKIGITEHGYNFTINGGYLDFWKKNKTNYISTFSTLISTIAAVIGVSFGIWMGIKSQQNSKEIKTLNEKIINLEKRTDLIEIEEV